MCRIRTIPSAFNSWAGDDSSGALPLPISSSATGIFLRRVERNELYGTASFRFRNRALESTHPTRQPHLIWVESVWALQLGPVLAATDYVRAVPDLIRTWVPRRYIISGRTASAERTLKLLRRFFEVDRNNIALAPSAHLQTWISCRSFGVPVYDRHSCTPPVPPPG